MENFGMILFGFGMILIFISNILIIIQAFKTSALWGLGCFFFPLVSLVFVAMHWGKAKKAFLLGLASIPFVVVSVMIGLPS